MRRRTSRAIYSGTADRLVGLVAIETGIAAIIGSRLTAISVNETQLAVADSSSLKVPESAAALAAGIAVTVGGIAVLALGTRARPILAALWWVIPVAALMVVRPALDAQSSPSDLNSAMLVGSFLPEFVLGPGSWMLIVAIISSFILGGLVLWAGNRERDATPDSVDPEDRPAPGRLAVALTVISSVVVLAAGVFPTYQTFVMASPYVAALFDGGPTIGELIPDDVTVLSAPVHVDRTAFDGPYLTRDWPPTIETWAAIAAGLALVAILWLSLRARPARACALLIGVAAVLIGWTTVGLLIEGAEPTGAAWLGLGAVPVLAAAALAVRADLRSGE